MPVAAASARFFEHSPCLARKLRGIWHAFGKTCPPIFMKFCLKSRTPPLTRKKSRPSKKGRSPSTTSNLIFPRGEATTAFCVEGREGPAPKVYLFCPGESETVTESKYFWDRASVFCPTTPKPLNPLSTRISGLCDPLVLFVIYALIRFPEVFFV